MTVKVTRNRERERQVWKGLVKPFQGNERSLDITHTNVSDLVSWCIRQSYFKKVYPALDEKEDEDFNNFIRGKSSEYIISNHIFAPEYTSQASYMFEGMIKGHPDLINKETKHVIELKDSNNTYHFTDPRHERYNSFDTYLTQVLCYMVMSDAEDGVVLVKHSNSKSILDRIGWKKKIVDKGDTIPLRSYDVHLSMDDPDREFIKDNLRLKATFFLKAVKSKDVRLLPLLKDAKSPESKCGRCPYKEICHHPDNADSLGSEEMRDILRHDYMTVKLKERGALEFADLGKLI